MDKLTENEILHGKWFLIHKKIDTIDLNNIKISNYKSIHAPTNIFYADPICVKRNGLYYIFFESYDYNKGKIAYYTLDDNLSNSEIKFVDIDINVHTSYPYIFEESGIYYMIPESCHQNNINLYECVSFPNKWKFRKTIVKDVHAADNSVIKYNNIYWLFTMIYKNNRYYFIIYYSDSLLGEWKEHKLVNVNGYPKNEHLTRNAGKIFNYNGKMIRPAQYSERTNGEFVILYEIKKLTIDSYHEIPLTIITKENVEGIRSIHTFTVCDNMICLDGRQERQTDKPYIPINLKEELKRIFENNFYVNHTILEEAFKCNTSGNGLCYYGIDIDGKSYHGERNWNDRWNLLKDSLEFNGKNVLEIGCNMGILSIYLKKFRDINKAVGVDQPDEMLIVTNKRDTIKAAKLLKDGFCVDDISFVQMDLNKEKYEEILGYDFDIVAAMSIYKWIEDKERFLNYLSKFKHIIYEGHEPDEVEIEKFTKFGFNHKILGQTQTGVSYSKDNTRTLILFSKDKS